MYFTKIQVKENIKLLRECKLEKSVITAVSKKFTNDCFAEIRLFLNALQDTGTFQLIIEILREQYYNLYDFVAENFRKDKMMYFLLEWDRYCAEVLKREKDEAVMNSVDELAIKFPITNRNWLDIFASINETVFEISQKALLDKQKLLLVDLFHAQCDLEMSETGLLLFGGACLAQTQLALENKATKVTIDADLGCGPERKAYDSIKFFIMTVEEKAELYDRLEDTLLMRKDRGRMFLPKLIFVPFIRCLLRSVPLTANNDMFEVYGVRMPQMCHAYAEKNQTELFNMFLSAASQLNIDETVSIVALKLLFEIWKEKIVNSRIADLFKAKQILDLEDSKRRRMPEGCQSLRQKLYALVHDE
jgi:hypothetical protein